MCRASLLSEKDRQNIDIYREFIETFSLFGIVGNPYLCVPNTLGLLRRLDTFRLYRPFLFHYYWVK